MNNPKISKKERNLIKGAIRRVFARSELRQKVIAATIVAHIDLSRPKVKSWCRCKVCYNHIPKSYMEVDHINPVVPYDKALEDMTWDELVNNLWCDENNLQAICSDCHDEKTKKERKIRKESKK
jgi:5-methylcytosine-specific restriction endonuclease McrA